jgi:hypothetical protein
MNRPSYTRNDTKDDYEQAPPEASKPSLDVGQVIVVWSCVFLLYRPLWLTPVGKYY